MRKLGEAVPPNSCILSVHSADDEEPAQLNRTIERSSELSSEQSSGCGVMLGWVILMRNTVQNLPVSHISRVDD